MSVDHERPFPVAEERLAFIAKELFPGYVVTPQLRAKIIELALMGELVEAQQMTNFHLGTAHEIYNQRFR